MYLPEDALQRFIALHDSLNEGRGWLSDASPLRFAAMAAVTSPGDPRVVADSIRATAHELKERAGWFGEMNGSLRFIVAAMLLQNEDSAADFMSEVDRARELFRSTGIRRGGIYEVMAILILRGPEKQLITADTVHRFQAIYAQMKAYHWWLTGPDDFPAAALLVHRAGDPQAIARRIEGIYQALRDGGFRRGNALQTAANLLEMAGEEPAVVASRFQSLYDAFRTEHARIWQNEYDELAILSFLDAPSGVIVEQVLHHQEVIQRLHPRPDRSLAFNLAASVAFIDVVRLQERVEGVTETKAMMDMQTIINAHQAAIAAATTAAVVASTSASSSS